MFSVNFLRLWPRNHHQISFQVVKPKAISERTQYLPRKAGHSNSSDFDIETVTPALSLVGDFRLSVGDVKRIPFLHANGRYVKSIQSRLDEEG